MSMVQPSNFTMVSTSPALARLVDQLAGEKIIAVDTESNSLYAYQEQVCLIQFSIPDGDYLVDPLALDDLSPLAPIFAHAGIEKVFHAAEYDVLCLKRDFKYEFVNLFDTMLAARILGRKEVGLGSVLEVEFGVQLDKRFQRADWGKRPISAELAHYACMDTHYLIPLRHRLEAALQDQTRLDLAHEDFRRMCALDSRVPETETQLWWNVSGAYDLSAQQAAVLKELCAYRDEVARNLNRPLFKVIGNNTLISISQSCPSSLNELKLLPGMTEGQVRRHGRALIEAVRRGLHAQPIRPPRAPRPSDQFLNRVDALKEWRKITARQLGVESDVVLPRDLLYEIAEQNPRCNQDLAAVLDSVPWRLEHFGPQILQVIVR